MKISRGQWNRRIVSPALIIFLLFIVSAASWGTARSDGGRMRVGAVIYEEDCARCHGLNGKGNGPDGKILIVPPANFQSRRSRSKTDFELFTTIAYGVAYSPMHGWRGRLSDEEILEVIGYIRDMAPFDSGF